MFGDVGMGSGGFAHLNPLRWSGLITFKKCIADLEAILTKGNRPIRVKVQEQTVEFDQTQDAIDYLKKKAERQKFLAKVQAASYDACSLLHNSTTDVQADRECVLAAVKGAGLALEHASDIMKSDKNVVMAAVTQDGFALEYASENMKSDKDVVMAAVTKNGLTLEYASENMKSDKDVVMAAVNKAGYDRWGNFVSGGWALQHASDKMKSDMDVVMAAVNRAGSDVVKHTINEEAVVAVVGKDGKALEFASDNFKPDIQCAADPVKVDDKRANFWDEKETVLYMVKLISKALEFASDIVQEQPNLIEIKLR